MRSSPNSRSSKKLKTSRHPSPPSSQLAPHRPNTSFGARPHLSATHPPSPPPPYSLLPPSTSPSSPTSSPNLRASRLQTLTRICIQLFTKLVRRSGVLKTSTSIATPSALSLGSKTSTTTPPPTSPHSAPSPITRSASRPPSSRPLPF